MKPPAGGQPGDSSYHQYVGYPAKQAVNEGGRSRLLAARCSDFCRSLPSAAAPVAVLFGFHVLNAVLGIGGAALVLVLLLFNFALLPLSVVYAVLWVSPEHVRLVLARWAWPTLTLVVVGALIGIQIRFGWVIFLVAAVYLPVLLGVFFVGWFKMATFFFLAVEDLAGYDVGLANFVNLATPQTPCAGSRRRRRPKMTRVATIDYEDPLEMQAALGGFIPRPVVLFCFITRKAWAVAAYFILVKLFVGILSSIAVLLSVVQPILAFASSGSFPCAGTGDTFQEDPVVYVSITTVLWMLGVVGIVVVPLLSVRLTAWACAEPEPEQQQQRVEVEQEEHEVAQMRSSEETNTSFVDLEATQAAVPLPSETMAA
ncbi:hypothetical protein BBJ28_00024327 [Nothophytophthora sp. Chile5]|nr:hypothetical protein BBJ28_00024327 [Nothophytophthora sp. Chile5]